MKFAWNIFKPKILLAAAKVKLLNCATLRMRNVANYKPASNYMAKVFDGQRRCRCGGLNWFLIRLLGPPMAA